MEELAARPLEQSPESAPVESQVDFVLDDVDESSDSGVRKAVPPPKPPRKEKAKKEVSLNNEALNREPPEKMLEFAKYVDKLSEQRNPEPNHAAIERKKEIAAQQARLKIEVFFRGVNGMAKHLAESGKELDRVMIFLETYRDQLTEDERAALLRRLVKLTHEKFPSTAPRNELPPQDDEPSAL